MELTVYSSFWCADCREAKRFLTRHNIPYEEIDIETTPGAAEEVVRHTGKRAIPQFVIDGRWVQPYRPGEGFLYEEMSELLGIDRSWRLGPLGGHPAISRKVQLPFGATDAGAGCIVHHVCDGYAHNACYAQWICDSP